MVDTCQDKTSPYNLRDADAPLLRAAASLGEWLMQQPESSEAHRQAIVDMLAFLRNLPNPPPHQFNAEFGFEVCSSSDITEGSFKYCWSVSVCRAGIEIFSIGNDAFYDFFWFLCPGCENSNDLSMAHEWIQQVADPRRLVPLNHHLVIDAGRWQVNEAAA